MTIQGKELALCIRNDPDYDAICIQASKTDKALLPTLATNNWVAIVNDFYWGYRKQFPGVQFKASDLLAAAWHLSNQYDD